MIDAILERRLESRLARLLQYGSYLGCVSIAIGLLIARWNGGSEADRGLQVVSAGIALLIALPILRLAVMLATFVSERDYRFAGTAASVLIVIGVSFAVGLLTKL